MKLLLYCTKSKWQLFRDIITGKWLIDKIKNGNAVNGKIVAECDYEVEKIFRTFDIRKDFYTVKVNVDDLYNKTCLTYEELCDYLGNGNNGSGYAIHINNLHIFDKPKELSDYYQYTIKGIPNTPAKNMQKAPQNMMRVFSWRGDDYILISIRPEWLCKILNGEKKIEVRKKVLKEMVK